MKTVYLIRDTIGTNQSLGTLLVIERGRLLFSSHLLERGWKNNEKNISCTTAGIYDLKLEYSSKFKMDLWEAYGIPGRSECKFHAANFWKELNGCYSPGEARLNIGDDSELDMVNSGDMLKLFMNAMGSDKMARLVIIDDNY